jgi:hypothetical protein
MSPQIQDEGDGRYFEYFDTITVAQIATCQWDLCYEFYPSGSGRDFWAIHVL